MAIYLLHFVHEHVSFRWAEFLALTSKYDCKFELISPLEHVISRPYIIVELKDDSTIGNLIESVRGSYLLIGLLELWATSTISVDDLSERASKSSQFLSGLYSGPNQSFRVNCESFGTKIAQTTKVEWIEKIKLLETFESKINLNNPVQTYSILEMNEKKTANGTPSKEYYFGRLVAKGNRSSIHDFSLSTRVFIANTSMDPMLSLIAANVAKVKPNDIIYDPFVGSGSLLVAAAYLGGYVLGADIDWLLLHGKSRPSRKGQLVREEGESVRANLRQYNLENRYLDVMISDVTRSPLVDGLTLDSIISDPPYGIRESSEKIGSKRGKPSTTDCKVRYPSKTSYDLDELLVDLLSLSAKHLSINGRLVYYLPITKTNITFDDVIPSHPCLELITYCEQALAAKVSRLMVVMEKKRNPMIGDKVNIPQAINKMNFRNTYFSKPDIVGNK